MKKILTFVCVLYAIVGIQKVSALEEIKTIQNSNLSDYQTTVVSKNAARATLETPSLSVLPVLNMIYIEIGEVTGANSYRIYRKSSSDSTYRKIYQGSDTSFVDFEDGFVFGETYTYKVQALKISSGQMIESNESIAVDVETPKITVNKKKVSLQVGKKERLTISSNTSVVLWSDDESIATIDKNGVITAKGAGTTYIGIQQSGTLMGEVVEVKVSFPKPVVKTYANGYDSIKIVTSKMTSATGYDIYRATSKNGVYTKLKTPTKLTYIDKSKVTSKYNVNSGWTYYYKVIAYRTVNGKKVYSPTTIVTGKTIPATTKVSLSKYNNKTIKVKWNKVAGASGYEIYRALSTKGKYTKIKTITKGSTISYNDGKRMRKRRYYYKVRSYRIVNGKKVYSNYSNIPSYVIK